MSAVGGSTQIRVRRPSGAEKSPRKEGTFYQERLLVFKEVSPRRFALVETTRVAFGC